MLIIAPCDLKGFLRHLSLQVSVFGEIIIIPGEASCGRGFRTATNICSLTAVALSSYHKLNSLEQIIIIVFVWIPLRRRFFKKIRLHLDWLSEFRLGCDWSVRRTRLVVIRAAVRPNKDQQSVSIPDAVC